MSAARLLILDDEPAVGQIMQTVAERGGHTSRFTTDPHEFLALVESWGPTHVAVDLVMPEMDGIDVLEALAGLRSRSAIIISSGVGGRVLEAARLVAVENGLHIVGVLTKPFRGASLMSLLAATDPTRDVPTSGARALTSTPVTAADLASALDDVDGVLVAYQPKVRCSTGRLAGFEVLARWTHPTKGLVSPSVFIPMAESEGLIDRLTDRVLDQALPWFVALPGGEGTTLSVNLSARTLRDPRFPDRLAASCLAHHVPPERVILELTETSATDDPVTSLRLLTRLRVKGFQLSLDDFGTGYSSMSMLARLPFSEIKVDLSFVQSATASEESRAVVKSVIDLGHSLGLVTTAEGVEDAATFELLRSLGSDLAQGYYLGRPMPPQQARSWSGAAAD